MFGRLALRPIVFLMLGLGLALASGTARAQPARQALFDRFDELGRHFKFSLKEAKKALAANDCRKFELEIGAARSRLEQMKRLLDDPRNTGNEGGVPVFYLDLQADIGPLEDLEFLPLVDDGCPKGAGFRPTSKIGWQI
jgi:hypothetical protein